MCANHPCDSNEADIIFMHSFHLNWTCGNKRQKRKTCYFVNTTESPRKRCQRKVTLLAHGGKPGITAASEIRLMTSKSLQRCSLPLAQDRVKRQPVWDCKEFWLHITKKEISKNYAWVSFEFKWTLIGWVWQLAAGGEKNVWKKKLVKAVIIIFKLTSSSQCSQLGLLNCKLMLLIVQLCFWFKFSFGRYFCF